MPRVLKHAFERDRFVGRGNRLDGTETADRQTGPQVERAAGSLVARLHVDVQLRRLAARAVQRPGNALGAACRQTFQPNFRWLDSRRCRRFEHGLDIASLRVPDIFDPCPHDCPLAGPRVVFFDLGRADLQDHPNLLDVREIVQDQFACRPDDPRCDLHPAHLRIVGEIEFQPSAVPLAVADMRRRHGESGAVRARSFDAFRVHSDRIHAQLGAVRRYGLVPEFDPAAPRFEHCSAPRRLRTVNAV